MSISEQMIPKHLLVFYQSYYGSVYYIEKHQINNGDVGPGAPISKKELAALFERFADKGKYYYKPNNNVLHYEADSISTTIIWKKEAHKRELLFHSGMNIESGIYPLPNLLFVKKGDEVSIYAYKNNFKNLYYAPIPNNLDSFCFGNASWSEHPCSNDTIASIEKAVFESMFTEFRENINPKNKAAFYNSIIGKDEFPLEALKKTNEKVHI